MTNFVCPVNIFFPPDAMSAQTNHVGFRCQVLRFSNVQPVLERGCMVEGMWLRDALSKS